jgi:hypothetical protein
VSSSNVIQFPTRSKPAQSPAAPAQETQPAETLARTEQSGQVPDSVVEMIKQSAAMTLIATLSFYANQGWDGGQKARAAMPAMKEMMAMKGIQVITQ